MEAEEIRRLSSLTLAYIGDGVYELAIRRFLLMNGTVRAEQLHAQAVELVRADFQSHCFGVLEPLLTEEERAVMYRGRNSKSGRQPKHAEMADYRRATGVEALIGHLFLQGRNERLRELFAVIYGVAEQRGTEVQE